MWKELRRRGERAPRCQLQRIMRDNAIQGAKRRGRPWRTTSADPDAKRRPDLVGRNFGASEPGELVVADFTYVRCWEGLVFFAFCLDVFSRMIVGWQLASDMRAELVVDALRMALGTRTQLGHVELVHHSDRGSQPGLNRSSQQRFREMNLRTAGDGSAGLGAETRAGVMRLSPSRLARRAGRSGDRRVRA